MAFDKRQRFWKNNQYLLSSFIWEKVFSLTESQKMDFIKLLKLEAIFYYIMTLSVLIAQRTIDTTISNKMNVARIGECFLIV
jgi:hypothetical protein